MRQIAEIRRTVGRSRISLILMSLLSVLFLASMCIMIRTQSLQTGFGTDRLPLYTSFMIVLNLVLLVATGWNHWAKASVGGMICAVCILFGFGASYQFLFSAFRSYVLSVVLAAAVGLVIFAVWRRVQVLGDVGFALVTATILVLLVINLLFGVKIFGARTRVPIPGLKEKYIQPGEFVKVLLVALCASAHSSRRRKAVYCATAVVCCGVMLVIHDVGSAVVIFLMLMLAVYLLYDNRKLSWGVVVAAVALFLVALRLLPYAQKRMSNWGKAMTPGGNSQQHAYIAAVLFGGFDGLGLEHCELMTKSFAAEHDGAIAGVLAVFGVPMEAVLLMTYLELALISAKNRSIHPSGFYVLTQMTVYILMSVLLNLCGGLDTAPFTGLVGCGVSFGLNAMIAFSILLGMAFGALCPMMKKAKGE